MLCFKHLLPLFSEIYLADATLTALWKFFHYQPLAPSPVCPNVTKWTAHDKACKSICNGYKQYLAVLSVYVSERNEPDIMGIFEQLSSPQLSQLFCF